MSDLSPDLRAWRLCNHAQQRVMRCFGRDDDVLTPEGVAHHAFERAVPIFARAIREGTILHAKAVEVTHGGYSWLLNPIRGIVVTVRDLEREADPLSQAGHRLWRKGRATKRKGILAGGLLRQEKHLARRIRRFTSPEGRGRRAPRYTPDDG